MTTEISGQRPLELFLEVGCISDPATLAMTRVARCQIDEVTVNGNVYDVQLDGGWTTGEFVTAVNTAAGETIFEVEGNDTIVAVGRPRANMQIACVTVDYEETFGQGPDRSPGPGTTGYVYDGSGSVNDGEYTVAIMTDPNLAGFNNHMGQITADATGDSNGRALIVNADFAPGEFYASPDFDLVEGQEYQVSFFAANTTDAGGQGLRPNVKLQLERDSDSSIVLDEDTGELPWIPSWQNFRYNYIARGERIRYRLSNNGAGGTGNDLAIDQIEFRRITRRNYVFAQRGFQEPVEIVKSIREDASIDSIRVFSPDAQTEYNLQTDIADLGRILSVGSCPVSASDFGGSAPLASATAFGQRYSGQVTADLAGLRIARLVVRPLAGSVEVDGMTLSLDKDYIWEAPAGRYVSGSDFTVEGTSPDADFTVHGEHH